MAREFELWFQEAHKAGMAAGEAHNPTPMYVGEAVGFSDVIDRSKPVYHVPEGVCGFAWVNFKGNTAFGRWAKKAGLARPAYGGGLQVWVSQFNQSMERKEAYASAFASVLKSHGVEAYSGSRMD